MINWMNFKEEGKKRYTCVADMPGPHPHEMLPIKLGLSGDIHVMTLWQRYEILTISGKGEYRPEFWSHVHLPGACSTYVDEEEYGEGADERAMLDAQTEFYEWLVRAELREADRDE